MAEIGRGGMGTVYRARQLDVMGRAVAVKVIRRDRADDAAARRFLRELKVLSVLHHPCTVQTYDAGVDASGEPFVAMELLDGQTLRDRLDERPVSQPQLCAIAADIARSLADAHGHGIVHRDISPDNVFLHRLSDGSEVVKVMDFGIARLQQEEGHGDGTEAFQTAADAAIGKVHFMSPEQCRSGDVDRRSDLYSLGVLMYVALAGKLPFDGDSKLAIAYMHNNAEPPPLPGTVLPNLASLVAELLASEWMVPSRTYRLSKHAGELTAARRDFTAFLGRRGPESPRGKRASAHLAAINSLLASQAKPSTWRRPVGNALIGAGATAAIVAVVMLISASNSRDESARVTGGPYENGRSDQLLREADGKTNLGIGLAIAAIPCAVGGTLLKIRF